MKKMLAEYLDKAIGFEHLAAGEKNAKLKADFERLAAAYRKLAAGRTKELKLPEPPPQSK
jgi:hypothetical protein